MTSIVSASAEAADGLAGAPDFFSTGSAGSVLGFALSAAARARAHKATSAATIGRGRVGFKIGLRCYVPRRITARTAQAQASRLTSVSICTERERKPGDRSRRALRVQD